MQDISEIISVDRHAHGNTCMTDLELRVIFRRVKVGILVFLVGLIRTVLYTITKLFPQRLCNDGRRIRTAGLGACLQGSATGRSAQIGE